MSSTRAAEPGRLSGTVALITGGSRGIGFECARALSAEGMSVVLVARDSDALRSAAARLGAQATWVGVDLSENVADMAQLVRRAVPSPAGPDVIVNNAAEFFVANAEETAIAAFERAVRVNLSAHFGLVHEFLAGMKRRGTGHIVTIGSIADQRGLRGNAAYSASKFGLRGLHQVLREELRGTGVRATLISPARVDTTIWESRGASGLEPLAAEGMLPAAAIGDAVRYAVTQPPEVNVDELRLSRS
jgi:NADP-dependent 3-hydroxy acid dehydrogenase YdfG